MEELNNTIEEQEQNRPENNELKEAITAGMQKIYNEGMIVGFQTACHTARQKIYEFESSNGKKSANDYKRCLKELKKFFDIGLSNLANSEKTTNTVESDEAETVQN